MASKTSRKHLLAHLLASVKAKQESSTLADDQAKADFIAASRTPAQARASSDKSRRKAIRAPRRTGKSWYVLSEATENCLRKPWSIWVIVGLSRPSVQQIFWGLFKQISKQLELHVSFLETQLIAKFPNGSQILFRGAESRSEIEKLRGGQYDGVIVDECKSFAPAVFVELVQDVIEPALGDRRGKLILIGTPGDQLTGPFYEATCEPPIPFKGADGVTRHSNKLYGSEDQTPYIWSLHAWTLRDNTECPWLWEEANKLKLVRGWSDDHPSWRREYLGHWVAAKDKFVYRYQPSRHDYDGELPEGFQPVYVLGLDVGWKDADAICVWAYSRHDYHVYQVYGEKRPKQNITNLARWLHQVADMFPIDHMVYDPAGGGAKIIAELAEIHSLYFDAPADKKDKNAYIELFNTELDAGRIHILRGNPLGDELLENRWLEKSLGTPKRTEDPKTPNDLCDAALYAWRVCDHRRPVPPDRKVLVEQSREWWNEQKRISYEKALAQHKARHAQEDDYSKLDRDWWRPTWTN